MINSSLTTLKILYYLQTESSPEEAVTTADILEYLKTQGIQADRRFVYKTIDNLIETGYPIQKVHSNYIIDHLTHYSYEYLFEVHLCAQ